MKARCATYAVASKPKVIEFFYLFIFHFFFLFFFYLLLHSMASQIAVVQLQYQQVEQPCLNCSVPKSWAKVFLMSQ